jgi:hypothetical protein
MTARVLDSSIDTGSHGKHCRPRRQQDRNAQTLLEDFRKPTFSYDLSKASRFSSSRLPDSIPHQSRVGPRARMPESNFAYHANTSSLKKLIFESGSYT